MEKELSHIFSPSAFDHTFGRHQELCSFELTVWVFAVLIICSDLFRIFRLERFQSFVLKRSVGKKSLLIEQNKTLKEFQ